MASQKQPLTVDGQVRKPDQLPSLLVTSTPPVVYDNTIILGATHPDIQSANPKRDGWFVSDFYAFNYLLKGLGSGQTLLTAADPHQLVERYGPYLHGNPYEDRKEVLSYSLLDNDQLSPVTVVKQADMIDRFLLEARKASERAKRENAPLLLLMFCHGFPNLQFLLNNDNKKEGLSATRLRGVLEPGSCVSLVATACYSGGWAADQDFDCTAMIAATGKDDATGKSNAWPDSYSIGRACGSVFASALIQTLSSNASPILAENKNTQLGMTGPSGTDTGLTGDAVAELQPDEPNTQQSLTYDAFCNSLWDTLEKKVNRLTKHQHFSFSTQDDQWEYAWTGPPGFSLAHFEERWNRLRSVAYMGLTDADLAMEEMTKNIYHGRVKAMARLFHQTCPGDWQMAPDVSFGGGLRGYYDFDEFEDEAAEFAATIRFRWEMGLLVDYIVRSLSLPMPNNEICILWNRYQWVENIKKRIPDWRQRQGEIYKLLRDGGFEILPLSNQGPSFRATTKLPLSITFGTRQD